MPLLKISAPVASFLRNHATPRDRAVIRAVLAYRANECVVQHGRCIFATEDLEGKKMLKPFRGLLPSLSDAFWPGSTIYEHRRAARHLKRNARATEATRGSQEPRRRASSGGKKKKSSARNAGKWSGTMNGSRIHNTLESCANRGGVLKNPAKASPTVHRILKALKKRNLLMICGELGVRRLGSNVATMIDIVCYDTVKHELVLVEIKSGYKDCFTVSERSMSGALAGRMANSPLNQALMQIMMGTRFLLDTLASLAMTQVRWSAYVIRADDHHCDVYRVNRAIYNTIVPLADKDLAQSQRKHYEHLEAAKRRKKALNLTAMQRRLNERRGARVQKALGKRVFR